MALAVSPDISHVFHASVMREEHGAAFLLFGVYITFLGWIPLLHIGRCPVVFRLDWAAHMAQNDNRNGEAGSG
jgi:hypothetical protein